MIGRQVISVREKPNNCYNCQKDVHIVNNLCKYICRSCKIGIYCSKYCQKQDWNNHRKLCQAINTLEKERWRKVNDKSTYNTILPYQDKGKVAGLVGEKCLIRCSVNNQSVEMLLDTCVQVSIVSRSYLKRNYPDLPVKPLSDILDDQDSFRVQWGNSTEIPFLGWVNMSVQIGYEIKSITLDIPYLVTSGELEYPILGFNAMREMVKVEEDLHILKQVFENAFSITDPQKIDTLVNLLTT